MGINASPIPGELSPANPHLLKVRDLVYHISGIYQPDHKLRFLEDRCERRMQQLGIGTLHEYVNAITLSSMRVQEVTELLNEVTVGETCFFRNSPQLDAFRRTVLPQVMGNKERLPIRHLRIWSAGCSTGEEPYTLAITMLEESVLLKGWTFEIFATDLNERSLTRAREGIYGAYSTRNMPAYITKKYFRNSGTSMEVSTAVKQLVKFSRLNLLDDARMAFIRNIDVVFCCNVLIYFDTESKSRVIQHFFNNLLPECFLFLGHSESLFGVTENFRPLHFPGATVYLKSRAVKRGLV
jgi:chemotaxis protein methyltransferase CheR